MKTDECELLITFTSTSSRSKARLVFDSNLCSTSIPNFEIAFNFEILKAKTQRNYKNFSKINNLLGLTIPMTNTPFDSFCKDFLEELLSPYGQIALNREILGESQYIDVFFTPDPQNSINANHLGLLGQIITTPCLLEPYRNPAKIDDIRSCLLKLLAVLTDQLRHHKRTSQIRSHLPPQLWILTPSLSQSILNRFGATPDPRTIGIYQLPEALNTQILIIHQLPKTSDTLWLRLLGRGKVQKQAIEEVLAIPDTNPTRAQVLRMLSSWKVSIELSEQWQQQERELTMALSQAFLDWEQKTEQRGLQQGLQQGLQLNQRMILSLLQRRLGEIPLELRSQVEALSLEQLESLAETLLDLVTLTDLHQWLEAHAS